MDPSLQPPNSQRRQRPSIGNVARMVLVPLPTPPLLTHSWGFPAPTGTRSRGCPADQSPPPPPPPGQLNPGGIELPRAGFAAKLLLPSGSHGACPGAGKVKILPSLSLAVISPDSPTAAPVLILSAVPMEPLRVVPAQPQQSTAMPIAKVVVNLRIINPLPLQSASFFSCHWLSACE